MICPGLLDRGIHIGWSFLSLGRLRNLYDKLAKSVENVLYCVQITADKERIM